MNFHKLKQVIKLITASVPRVGSLRSAVPGLGAAVAFADAVSAHQSAVTSSSCFLYLAGPAVPLYSAASGLCQFCRMQYIISPQRSWSPRCAVLYWSAPLTMLCCLGLSLGSSTYYRCLCKTREQEDGRWTLLLTKSASVMVQPGDRNHLVICRGDLMYVIIN